MTCSWVVVIVAVTGVVMMAATVCVTPSCDAGEVIYKKSKRQYVVYFCRGHHFVLQN